MTTGLTASIVINTYNRGASLRRTLESLRFIDHPRFEVVVVNGPSTDDTDVQIAPFAGEIKLGKCPVANLSVSRNIGIAMASGDVVAFIDDDAIPEPEWLENLLRGYDSAEVGGVGGFVFNHTGHEFQSRYIVCDRFGRARMEHHHNPTSGFNFPGSFEYCSHLGTNSSFRRDRLIAIGGFDEEFEYYLDETDVCLRMVDSGHVVKFVEDAFIHHKFAPSHLRNEHRVVKNYYPIIKNRAYFAVRNASAWCSFPDLVRNVEAFIHEHRAQVHWAVGEKLLPESERAAFEETANRALADGLKRALSTERKLISPAALRELRSDFKPFAHRLKPRPERLTLCYLSQDYPPAHYGGIARFTHDLARGMAREGHLVHVVTRSPDHDRVDFEDGVWVHRLAQRDAPGLEVPASLGNTRRILGHAHAAHSEVRRIHAHHPIDVIEAPIWDSEGWFCIQDEELGARTIVSLETTLKLAAEAQRWDVTEDLSRAIALEEQVLVRAAGFHAISAAIVDSVESAYTLKLPREKIGMVPLGIQDRVAAIAEPRGSDFLTVLFVGRLERRKGVDVLLEVAPRILRARPDVRFVLVGDDTIPAGGGKTYKQGFLEGAGEDVKARVLFTGRASEEDLYAWYSGCDVFVAPSRYESFGLIFLEAMMLGKPVIGCRAGGMVEIIEEKVNGLLAEPGDSASLERCLLELIDDDGLRRACGRRSRELFEQRFTDARMVEKTAAFYRSFLARLAPRMPGVAA